MPNNTHHKGTIYKQQPTSTGQVMYVSTGCKVVDENVSTAGSTLSTTFKSNGFSVISSTHVCTLAAGSKGDVKEILFQGTTLQMALKTAGGMTINNSTDDVITVLLGTTKAKEIGAVAKLTAASTAKWWLDMSYGSSDITVTLSSAT